jgi:hypothetical protein
MRLYCSKFMGKNNPLACQFGVTLKFEKEKWQVAE